MGAGWRKRGKEEGKEERRKGKKKMMTAVVSLGHINTQFYLKSNSGEISFTDECSELVLRFLELTCNVIKFINTNDSISNSRDSTDSPLCNLSIYIFQNTSTGYSQSTTHKQQETG